MEGFGVACQFAPCAHIALSFTFPARCRSGVYLWLETGRRAGAGTLLDVHYNHSFLTLRFKRLLALSAPPLTHTPFSLIISVLVSYHNLSPLYLLMSGRFDPF
jgi:hypothetical protein